MWYGNKYSVDLSHAVWTHETDIAQCPQIHTSQFSLKWMLLFSACTVCGASAFYAPHSVPVGCVCVWR